MGIRFTEAQLRGLNGEKKKKRTESTSEVVLLQEVNGIYRGKKISFEEFKQKT